VTSNKEIFDQFVNIVIPELQKVSGSFGKTIEVETTENSMTIYASPFIRVLIDGRKPTSFGAKKGNPTLQQAILDWIDRKNITPYAKADGNIPTKEQLSWIISKSIHLYGTKLYQRGGGNNIFDSILTANRIDNLLSLMSQKYYTQITSIVK
jgi:hypothetical protein